MVKIMENPTKMDDLGDFPIFLETPISICRVFLQMLSDFVVEIAVWLKGGKS